MAGRGSRYPDRLSQVVRKYITFARRSYEPSGVVADRSWPYSCSCCQPSNSQSRTPGRGDKNKKIVFSPEAEEEMNSDSVLIYATADPGVVSSLERSRDDDNCVFPSSDQIFNDDGLTTATEEQQPGSEDDGNDIAKEIIDRLINRAVTGNDEIEIEVPVSSPSPVKLMVPNGKKRSNINYIPEPVKVGQKSVDKLYLSSDEIIEDALKEAELTHAGKRPSKHINLPLSTSTHGLKQRLKAKQIRSNSRVGNSKRLLIPNEEEERTVGLWKRELEFRNSMSKLREFTV